VRLFCFYTVKTVENLPVNSRRLNALLNQLKVEGVEVMLTVALPLNLLAMLSSKIPVHIFEMRSTTLPAPRTPKSEPRGSARKAGALSGS
jgi:hypothetical protein